MTAKATERLKPAIERRVRASSLLGSRICQLLVKGLDMGSARSSIAELPVLSVWFDFLPLVAPLWF